jgi:hypothetical protein
MFPSGMPSLTQKTFMAVSQSVTLTDHLLKCVPKNFSGLSASTKLAIDNSRNDLLLSFWIVKELGNFQIKSMIKSRT